MHRYSRHIFTTGKREKNILNLKKILFKKGAFKNSFKKLNNNLLNKHGFLKNKHQLKRI